MFDRHVSENLRKKNGKPHTGGSRWTFDCHVIENLRKIYEKTGKFTVTSTELVSARGASHPDNVPGDEAKQDRLRRRRERDRLRRERKPLKKKMLCL